MDRVDGAVSEKSRDARADGDGGSRERLVQMLQEAARLEHCLLNSYLAAACSLKSTPQEFAEISGKPNRRRAVQFERVRAWKQSILEVAHEEMRHLHYVQCMIRALGERPHFGLPDRDADGAWIIPNWNIHVGEAEPYADGTPVPIGVLDEAMMKRFVLYESTDSLQDQDPFSAQVMELLERLYDFELNLRFESMVGDIRDGEKKNELSTALQKLYRELEPVEPEGHLRSEGGLVGTPPPSKLPRFQSIADFYEKGVLPLYEQAFAAGWVVVSDRNLVDDQLNPAYAREGFLPVGPIGRSARFARFSQQNDVNPLADYKQVADIVREIVTEGEGSRLFAHNAQALLDKLEEIGVAGYLEALRRDALPGAVTPDWLANAQNLRKSHLYAFAMILVEHHKESELAEKVGVTFEPVRRPAPLEGAALAKLTAELPAQFNACYVAMLAWLARMYETRDWDTDQSRRRAIEMIATWPLMSLAIRPFLELASLFPIELRQLFRTDEDGLPKLPIWAEELVQLYNRPERSEQLNQRMDWLVVRVLRGVSQWASEQIWAVENARLHDDDKSREHDRQMILTRLRALSRLDEFERQFPYRVAGGYSDRSPNLGYRNQHPDSTRFEEDPTRSRPLFAGGLVLRLRFRGWGLVQLATDPDPPTDESGCTGTIMLHAADGDRRFDRAVVFQDFQPELNIRRAIDRDPPPLGVNCVEAALLAPALSGGAIAGYKPIQTLSSTGAVQASGVQQDLAVHGLHEVVRIGADSILDDGRKLRLFLQSKNGVRPFLNGDNHLIWQDGEPIDPFILEVYADDPGGAQRLFRREVFNQGRSIREMEPYERLRTCRGPAGFDSVSHIPAWARTDEVRSALGEDGFPRSFLRDRSRALIEQLKAVITPEQWNQQSVDEVVSLAERLLLTARPKGTTVGWLTALLHYGHTVSGEMAVGSDGNPILEALGAATSLELATAAVSGERSAPNARWLVSYTKGLMDVDALSDFVYGDLYIPLTATGRDVLFRRGWTFPAAMKEAVVEYACDFSKPFWARYQVDGDVRTVTVPGLDRDNPAAESTLTERLTSRSAAAYRYEQTGFPGMESFQAAFAVSADGEVASLSWQCEFRASTPDVMVRCYAFLAGTADAIGAALADHFSVRPGAVAR